MTSDNKVIVTNIQRFSLHDGPGIRTTVFFKGCALRCPWCSNPENINANIENYVKDGVQGQYGRWMSSKDILEEILKDEAYYTGAIDSCHYEIDASDDIERLPGGVTFSGGEALLQLPKLKELLDVLRSREIHIAIESCLYAPEESLCFALDYVNLFYIDLKVANAVDYRQIVGGDLNVYLRNLKILLNAGTPIIIRVPVIGEFTDSVNIVKNNVECIKEWTKHYPSILKVEIIKGHNLGNEKYKSLGLKTPPYMEVRQATLDYYLQELKKNNITCEICKI